MLQKPVNPSMRCVSSSPECTVAVIVSSPKCQLLNFKLDQFEHKVLRGHSGVTLLQRAHRDFKVALFIFYFWTN